MAGYILMEELRKRPVYKDRIDDIVLETIGDHVCRCTGYHRYFRAIKDVILREDEKAENAEKGGDGPGSERFKRLLKDRRKDYVAPLASTISFQITKRSDNDPSDKILIGSFEKPSGSALFVGSLDWANCRKLKVWVLTDSLKTGIRVRDLNLRNYFFRTTMKAIAAAAKKTSPDTRGLNGGSREDEIDEDTGLSRNDQTVLMFELRHAREVDERTITAAANMGTPVPVRFHGDMVFAGKRLHVGTEMLVYVISASRMRIVSQQPLRIEPRDLEFSIDSFEKEFGIPSRQVCRGQLRRRDRVQDHEGLSDYVSSGRGNGHHDSASTLQRNGDPARRELVKANSDSQRLIKKDIRFQGCQPRQSIRNRKSV